LVDLKSELIINTDTNVNQLSLDKKDTFCSFFKRNFEV